MHLLPALVRKSSFSKAQGLRETGSCSLFLQQDNQTLNRLSVPTTNNHFQLFMFITYTHTAFNRFNPQTWFADNHLNSIWTFSNEDRHLPVRIDRRTCRQTVWSGRRGLRRWRCSARGPPTPWRASESAVQTSRCCTRAVSASDLWTWQRKTTTVQSMPHASCFGLPCQNRSASRQLKIEAFQGSYWGKNLSQMANCYWQ